MILISIVVPFYNIEKEVILACVNSIINQTYGNIEAFLIDDGNKKEISEYLDELARTYDCINVIHQENSGVSVARNAGIMASSGEYIVFVDGDDCLAPKAVEAFVKTAESTDADIIYGEHVVFKNECKFLDEEFAGPRILSDKNLVMRSMISSGASTEIGLHGAPWGKAFNRKLLVNNNVFYDKSLPRSQDNEFNFRAVHFANKLVYIPIKVYGYRESEESAMTRYRTDSKKIQELYLDTVINDAKKYDIYSMVEHDIAIITIIKFFDVCNTNVLHKQNRISFGLKVKKVKRILSEKRYCDALKSVKVSEFEGAPKLFVFLLEIRAYYLYCIAHCTRRKLKSLKR